MSQIARVLLICLIAAGQRASAADLDDSHLSVIPRTSADATMAANASRPTTDFTKSEVAEDLPGGAATQPTRTAPDAFSQPSANMDMARQMDFSLGNRLFRKNWVAAPSPISTSDGLGPLFNARACQECHIKDGRGHPPTAGDPSVSMVLRLSIPGGSAPAAIANYLLTMPDRTYGDQLQDRASPGQLAEGVLSIRNDPLVVPFADQSSITLQAPTYSIASPAYGPVPTGLMISPRVAPQIIGLGLIEAIPAADILALADEDDADGDGISGRANIVWSAKHNAPLLGRFGLKAGIPTVRQQSALAFSADMGLSSRPFPDPSGDCTAKQPDCRAAPNGQAPGLTDGIEVDDETLDLITFYARNLAVPARRNVDEPQVLAGKQVFYTLGCTACHRPKFVTNRLNAQPEQSAQLIWPYSDLLLHDMGEGLADHRPEARATGLEWRTPPLWGIGLAQAVNPKAGFLHDGRARTLTEAILWHGGEAQVSRDKVLALPKQDRDALIRFLESL